MISSFSNIDPFSFEQGMGYVATIIGIGAFSVKSDKKFKIILASAMFMWAVHYALLLSWSSAATSLVLSLCQYLSLAAPKLSSRSKAIVSVVVVSLFTAIMFFTWVGPRSIWPWLVGVNAVYAFVYLEGVKMRLQVMVSTGCWLINAIIVGSIGHMITTSVTLAINGWTAYRLYRDSNLAKIEAIKAIKDNKLFEEQPVSVTETVAV